MKPLLFALLFALAACLKDETISGYADPAAIYRLTELNGRPFTARATIGFAEPGTVAGEAACNRYSANQAAPYPWISIGPIAATKRACPDLAQEAAFFAALASATLAEVAGDTLILSDEVGGQMVFRVQD